MVRAGVGDVGDVHAALGAAGEVPDQPALDGAEEDVAALGALAQAGRAVEQPADARARRSTSPAAGRTAAGRGRRRARGRAVRAWRRCGCPARRSPARPGCRCAGPTAPWSRAGWRSRARRPARRWRRRRPAPAGRSGRGSARSRSASCSTQPGRGKCCWCSRCTTETSRPRASNRMHRVEVVPWSIDITYRWTMDHLHHHRDAPRSRDTARAASRTWPSSFGCRAAVVLADALHRAGHADRADHDAAVAADRRRDAGLAGDHLAVLQRPARFAYLRTRALDRGLGDQGAARVSLRSGLQRRIVGQQHLAERRRVQRQQRADVEGLQAVVRPEHVVHDQHPAVQGRADPDRLAAAGRQRVGPVDRPGPQLVDVQVARAQVQQRRAELVLARVAVLLDEPDALQRAQDPVRGALGQLQRLGDLADAQPSRAARQQPQDRGGALDGLDRTRHVRDPSPTGPDSTMSNIHSGRSTMPTGVR